MSMWRGTFRLSDETATQLPAYHTKQLKIFFFVSDDDVMELNQLKKKKAETSWGN